MFAACLLGMGGDDETRIVEPHPPPVHQLLLLFLALTFFLAILALLRQPRDARGLPITPAVGAPLLEPDHAVNFLCGAQILLPLRLDRAGGAWICGTTELVYEQGLLVLGRSVECAVGLLEVDVLEYH